MEENGRFALLFFGQFYTSNKIKIGMTLHPLGTRVMPIFLLLSAHSFILLECFCHEIEEVVLHVGFQGVFDRRLDESGLIPHVVAAAFEINGMYVPAAFSDGADGICELDFSAGADFPFFEVVEYLRGEDIAAHDCQRGVGHARRRFFEHIGEMIEVALLAVEFHDARSGMFRIRAPVSPR